MELLILPEALPTLTLKQIEYKVFFFFEMESHLTLFFNRFRDQHQGYYEFDSQFETGAHLEGVVELEFPKQACSVQELFSTFECSLQAAPVASEQILLNHRVIDKILNSCRRE